MRCPFQNRTPERVAIDLRNQVTFSQINWPDFTSKSMLEKTQPQPHAYFTSFHFSLVAKLPHLLLDKLDKSVMFRIFLGSSSKQTLF